MSAILLLSSGSRAALCGIALTIAATASPGLPQSTDQAKTAREIRPDDYVSPEALRLIQDGQRLCNRGQYDEAIAAYEAAMQKAGKPLFSVYLALGAAHFAKSDFKSAIETYNQAVVLRPRDFRPHFNLGEALYNSGDFQAAEKEYRKALELAPNQANAAQAHQFIALCLYNEKRPDEAVVEYKIAIAMSKGNYAEAHYNLGIVYMERGDNQSAEAEFRTAIQQDKGKAAQDHYNLGVVLEKLKRYADAADEYEEYLRLSPQAEDASALRMRVANLRKHK